jgi:hypothetical protein
MHNRDATPIMLLQPRSSLYIVLSRELLESGLSWVLIMFYKQMSFSNVDCEYRQVYTVFIQSDRIALRPLANVICVG